MATTLAALADRLEQLAGHDARSFGALLQAHIDARGVSRNAFALRVSADPSYVTRICAGERGVPSRHYIDAMARELQLRGPALNTFYAKAGYCPPDLGEDWPDTHAEVARVLNDYHISFEDKVEFATLVQTIARRYRPAAR